MAVATCTVRSLCAVQLLWVRLARSATSRAMLDSWRELSASSRMAPWTLSMNWLKLRAISLSSSWPGRSMRVFRARLSAAWPRLFCSTATRRRSWMTISQEMITETSRPMAMMAIWRVRPLS